jgi:hypothetical protein
MPLDPTTITGLVTANLSATGLIGISVSQLASAIGTGLSAYAAAPPPLGITVTTIDSGLVGSGKGTGYGIILPPPDIQGKLQAAFAGSTIIGPITPQLATGLATAISQALGQAIINTVNVGVGNGAGKVILVPSSGASFFIAGFASQLLVGVYVSAVATAIATGLDASLPSGQGIIAISGASGFIGSSGTGLGKIS